MTVLASGLTQSIVGFSDLFSKRAWPLAQVLLAGTILAVGPRMIAAVLRVMGMAEEKQFQKYHRAQNRVNWSTLAASRRLLYLLLHAFVPQGPVLMALDARLNAGVAPGSLPRASIAIQYDRVTAISQGQRFSLAMPDAVGADSLGRTLLGITVLFGAGAVGALLPGPQALPQ